MSLADVTLHRVETVDEASEFMRWLGERRHVLAFDCETTGLNWWEPNFTRLIQIGDTQTGWAFGREWFGVVREAFRKYTGPTVAQNRKFDMHALEAADIPPPPMHNARDTLVEHSLLEPLERHGLKHLSTTLIDRNAGIGEQMLNKAKKLGGWGWHDIPEHIPAYWAYGAFDTVLTARIDEKLYPQIQSRFSTQFDREMGYLNVMYGCEKRGLRIDRPYTERLVAMWEDDLKVLRSKLNAFGVGNPNSARQIEAALRSEEWEPEEFTDTGQAKLDKKVLEGLDYEVVQVLLEYRRKQKWLKAYLHPFLDNADANGFIHPSINTLGARTGRSSVNIFPLQQLPKVYEIRRCILPNTPDERIHTADYKSQEYVYFAHRSESESLLSAIRSGRDPHCYTASQVYGVPYEEISKEDPRRQLAKNTIYALMYGGGAAKIAETAGVPVEDVELFIKKMDVEFPEIREFMRENERIGQQRLGSDNRAWIETEGGRHFVTEADKLYKLTNGIIQGSCADILKEKTNLIAAMGLDQHIMIQVHDDTISSVPNSPEGVEIAREIAEAMRELEAFSVPMDVDTGGPYASWGHAVLKPGEVGWDEQQTAEEQAA